MPKHYTAIIEVIKVVEPGPKLNSRGYPDPLKSDEQKKKVEVARVVIRADSIESLITKATAHLNLVEDIPDGD